MNNDLYSQKYDEMMANLNSKDFDPELHKKLSKELEDMIATCGVPVWGYYKPYVKKK